MHPSSQIWLDLMDYAHLPEHLRVISQPFCELAQLMAEKLPPGPLLTATLREIWQAKNLAVSAVVAARKAQGL